MSISVIITTYNRAHIVHKAIDSVLAQTHPPMEILIVDDGSKDDTRERIGAYGERVRYIHRENGGLSRARNTGIEAARGQWISFLDDDDEFQPEKLAIHAQSIARHPDIDVHAMNTVLVSEGGQETNLWQLRGLQVSGEGEVLSRPLVWISRACFFTQPVLFRRQALLDVGMYDPSMIYEDLDLFCRLPFDKPWSLDCRAAVRLFRRADTNYNLSQGIADKPRISFQCLVKIYDGVLKRPGLTGEERTHIRKLLAAYRFDLGRVLMREGNQQEAQQCFVDAMRDDPTFKVRIKGYAALASKGWSLDVLRSLRSRRGGLRRSKPALAPRG